MERTVSKYVVPITPEHATQGRVGKVVVLTGESLQFSCIYLNPGVEIPWNSHPNETMVTVVAGGYEMWVGEEHFKLVPGLAAWIPANVSHRAVVGEEPTIELEAFAPPRDEYAAKTPHADFRHSNSARPAESNPPSRSGS